MIRENGHPVSVSMSLTWSAIAGFEPIFLNLGGGRDCHPRPEYQHYVSVDTVARADCAVVQDLGQPVPLADGSVSRILSEHFLEHVDEQVIGAVLSESHRLLKPGGLARFAVPDYGHPRKRYCLALGRDPDRHDHVTLTTFERMKSLIAASPFKSGHFYHYWDGDTFVAEPVDYSLGYVRRTPDNHPHNQCRGFWQHCGRYARDIGEYARHGTRTTALHRETRRYHQLAVTSLVVDLLKP
jgi:predicted SAM-dependent methyltransferase